MNGRWINRVFIYEPEDLIVTLLVSLESLMVSFDVFPLVVFFFFFFAVTQSRAMFVFASKGTKSCCLRRLLNVATEKYLRSKMKFFKIWSNTPLQMPSRKSCREST